MAHKNIIFLSFLSYLSANVGKSNQIGMFWGSFEVYTNFNICTHAINAYNKCIIVPMYFLFMFLICFRIGMKYF